MNVALRKITVNLPADIVDSAVAIHGKGLTETIRDALEAQKAEDAYRRIEKLRGEIQFEDWRELAGKYDEDAYE